MIGKTIWRFDLSHRVYPPKKPGEIFSNSSPIYREYWVPVQVIGENRRSWLCGVGSSVLWKVPKVGPHPGWAFTEQEIDDAVWVGDYRNDIAYRVRYIKDAALLRKVAELIEWKPGEKR